MNRYKLVHVTQFSYDGPVSESYNELRLRPRHDDSQSCLSFRITTNPDSRAIGHQDYYGNWVHQFHILPEHRKLRVEAEGVILMHPVPPPPVSTTTLAELDTRRAELTEEIPPVRDADGKIDVQVMTQAINSVIEGWIREYPEQWLWLHRRWR